MVEPSVAPGAFVSLQISLHIFALTYSVSIL